MFPLLPLDYRTVNFSAKVGVVAVVVVVVEVAWDSLELRRKYLSLVQMYKIIFGYCDINCHHYFDIIGLTRTRSRHEYKIRPKVARTNYFKYSLYIRLYLVTVISIAIITLILLD